MSNTRARLPQPVASEHIALKARNVSFSWDSTPLHWLPGDPFTTHTINVLHLLLPAGERWFVHVYKQVLPLIRDERLREDVIGFIGQEAMHSQAHDEVLPHLREQGLDPTPYTAQVDWLFEKLLGDRTLPLTLMEANLLRYLLTHEGKAVSRKETKRISYRLSGHVGTDKAFSFRYGVASARIKMQKLQGQHASFWSQPTDENVIWLTQDAYDRLQAERVQRAIRPRGRLQRVVGGDRRQVPGHAFRQPAPDRGLEVRDLGLDLLLGQRQGTAERRERGHLGSAAVRSGAPGACRKHPALFLLSIYLFPAME